ncbi:MAG: hypothetical protein JNL62_24025 [Bryobacterales bacterium]|nr:hypothetical protein [Bryobacterales bacterium]
MMDSQSDRLRSKFWIPFALCLVAAPVAVFSGVASSGAGHGSYLIAKLLFPFTMISTVFFGSITSWSIAFAFIQYPAYGMFLGFMNRRARIRPALVFLAGLHLIVAALCFLVPNANF